MSRLAVVLLLALVLVPVAVAPAASAYGGCFPHFRHETVYHPVTRQPVARVPVYDGMVC